MKAALYLRGSKEEIDLRNQRDPLLQLATARAWDTVEYLEQETGDDERAHRPVFASLLEDARRGRVRVIAVAGLDRLTRRAQRLVDLFDNFERWNTSVVSLREGDQWTELPAAYRRIVLLAIGTVAEQELMNLRDRTRKGIEKARRRGTKSGKAIGRPKANQLMLGAAARHRQAGMSFRKAAHTAGVSEASLRRYMARLEAARAPQNDEGGSTGTGGAP